MASLFSARNVFCGLDGALPEHEEAVADHRQSALGFRRSGFVLNDVPVLCQASVLDAEDVNDDHRPRSLQAREATVEHHVVALGDRERIFVPKRWRERSHALEQAVAPGAISVLCWT
jgi:hypothetical protein